MTGVIDRAKRAKGVKVRTPAEMRALGRRLASQLKAGDLVVLSGALGAGKTTLAQGIGEGLQVRGPVTSPTFVIARVHPPGGSGPALVHVDAYRLNDVAEVDDLDLDADLDRSVTVVEWGEGLVERLAGDRLEITIARSGDVGSDDETRVVRLGGVGARWARSAAMADALRGHQAWPGLMVPRAPDDRQVKGLGPDLSARACRNSTH